MSGGINTLANTLGTVDSNGALRVVLASGSPGSGTVTTVSVTTANGVSGSVANPTTTPAITLTLGAITPSSVAATGAVSDSVGSMATIRAGGIALASQAAYDLFYAASASQLARLANGTTGQVLTANTGAAPSWTAVSGTGTVTTVSVVTANGVSGSVSNPTTTPAITLTLGAITPSSVAATGAVSDSVGSMATIRAGGISVSSQAQYDLLYASSASQLARIANGTTGQVLTATTAGAPSWAAVAAAAGSLTGTTLAANVVTSSLTALGTVTTGVWNAGAVTSSGAVTDSVGSMATIRAGGISVSSQAQYDLLYASSASQLARIANGTTGQVLTATTAGAPSWQAANIPPLYSASGTSTDTSARVIDSYALASQLGATDRLIVRVTLSNSAGSVGQPFLYNGTDSISLGGCAGYNLGSTSADIWTAEIAWAANNPKKVAAFHNFTTGGTAISAGAQPVFTTDATGNWTLQLKQVSASAGTVSWAWSITKVNGS